MQPTVYIVQEPTRRNRNTGQMESTFDLTPAAAYGDLKVMLPPGNVMLSSKPMSDKLKHELRNFNDNDFLLAIGAPAAFATATAIAAKFNMGRYKLLTWDRESRAYISVSFDI